MNRVPATLSLDQHTRAPRDDYWLQWVLGGLAVGIGVIGLMRHSSLRDLLESRIDVHALLALIMCALVVSRFWTSIQAHDPIDAAHLEGLSRHSTRLAYLLLYLIIGLRALLGTTGCEWTSTTCDLSVFVPRSDAGNALYSFNPHDDFQALLLCGLFVLAVIRILALFIYVRGKLRQKTRRVAAKSPNPRHRWLTYVANSGIASRFRAR